MKFIIAAITVAFSFSALKANAGPLDVNGLWLTQSKTGHVQIINCDDGTPCGTLVWIDAPNPQTQMDDNNPDMDMQSRPLVGVKMLWGFTKNSKGWRKGKIYSPKEGKTYRSAIKHKPNGTLEVKGCFGPICQAQVWTRVTAASTANAQP